MKSEKTLKNDKRAVSPVIGVILMVAITVILAAVIAAFVFGYGAPAAAPQASMKIKTCSAATGLILEHTGGDSVVLADTKVVWDGNIAAAGGQEDLGVLTESVNLGSTASFDPGEETDAYAPTAITEGNTALVTVIHTLSGQQIFSGTKTITA